LAEEIKYTCKVVSHVITNINADQHTEMYRFILTPVSCI